MSVATLDGFSDPFHSREEELKFENDVVEGSFWTEAESLKLEEDIAEIERLINSAPAIGRKALHDATFNMNHKVGDPLELDQNPLHKLWF